MEEQSVSGTSFWQDFGVFLMSEQALWLYSWIGLALAMIVLAWLVAFLTHRANVTRSADFVEKVRGAKPLNPDKIRKKIDRLRRFQRNKTLYVAGLMTVILVAGAVVPGAMLAMIAVWQDWFLPGPAALLVNGMPFAPAQAGSYELGLFVVDQALRGGLADTLEVFRVAFTPIENNPENFAYSGLVVLYRLIAGAAVAAMLGGNACCDDPRRDWRALCQRRNRQVGSAVVLELHSKLKRYPPSLVPLTPA